MTEFKDMGRALDWEDCIENDSPNFPTLPAGEYPFTITAFERQHYQPGPSAKLPPCKMAVLTLRVEHEEEVAQFQHRLYLHSSVEGLLCSFFTSIGQRKHGERVQMNWNAVLGAKGLAKLGVRSYVTNNGDDRTINEVLRFLDPDIPSGGKAQGYTPGSF